MKIKLIRILCTFSLKSIIILVIDKYNLDLYKKGCDCMKTNTIITIARESGSGGKEIGRKIAEDLGIKCYDKELLARAAKDSGFAEELFENHDEKPTNSFLYSLVMDTYSFGYASPSYIDMPLNHKIFLAQFETIKNIANEGPCVIVGRCADYALADYKNCVNIFIHGNLEDKVNRIMNLYKLSEDKAKDLIKKTDKSRSSYYNYYSNKKWGEASGYHLSIDSGLLGIDGTAKLIEEFVSLKEKKDIS